MDTDAIRNTANSLSHRDRVDKSGMVSCIYPTPHSLVEFDIKSDVLRAHRPFCKCANLLDRSRRFLLECRLVAELLQVDGVGARHGLARRFFAVGH